MPELTTLPRDLLADNKVKNCAGQDIGRVEQFLFDPITGQISHAVVAFGGFLGATDRLFAVPWHALELDCATRTFHLLADRHTLRTAPKFTRGDEDHLRIDYLEQVDAHFRQNASCYAA